MIDLRSDTCSRPTEAMRRAMAEAPVGDDVYGDDPTVRLLEEQTAALLGKEDAVYMVTGSMTNQVAIRAHTVSGCAFPAQLKRTPERTLTESHELPLLRHV
jgi:threonine aldolase